MDDVTISEATLVPGCGLYAYSVDEARFDDLALAAYFASGKFDKASMHRWSSGNLLGNPHKAQNFRASVDNAVALLPVGRPAARTSDDEDPIAGSVVIAGFSRGDRYVPVCVSVATGEPFELDKPYAEHVLPVHVVTTMCGKECDFDDVCVAECGTPPGLEWKHHPRLPEGLHALVHDLGDALLESEGMTYDSVDGEYVRQHVVAAGFSRLLRIARETKTPLPRLEFERLRRLEALENHLRTPGAVTRLPPTRRTVGRVKAHQLSGVMATYEKYATMFGRLLDKKKSAVL
jgi:hypothetical protein